jgi:PAS domain S-box-containing protein
MSARSADGNNILLCAPFGSDAKSIATLLSKHGMTARVCLNLDEAARHFDDSTSAVLLTEEALRSGTAAIADALGRQEPWSDMPFVLLAARQTGLMAGTERARLKLPDSATNVIVLERPLGIVSLISAVDSAVRSRRKQFEMRDRLVELAESRQALETSEAELRLIANSLPVLIAFVDRELRYRFANAAYEEWFYRPPQDVIGHTLEEMLGPAAFTERRSAIERALAGETAQLQMSWPHRDGSRREADIRYLPRRNPQGDIDGFHIFVMDITDRIRVEESLRQQADTLEEKVLERTAALHAEMANRATAEAALRQSQKMEAVGQLTGGIAHDFNNMLTGVIGAMDIMKRRVAGGRTDGLDKYIDVAAAAANRAAALTQRLLAFSRRQSLDTRAVDVNALVSSLEDLLVRTVDEKIRIRLDLKAGLPAALADPNQLESAILNLVINARDAMPDGGELSIETDQVSIEGDYAAARQDMKPGSFVVLRVSDTGVGMPQAVLDKAFEPFFTTKPVGQGSGLGLSMVHGYVNQSGGQVRIHSNPGKGTSVTLFLPQSEAAESSTEIDHVRAVQGAGQTVLLVEDDDSVRLLVSEVIEELGYTAIEAAEPNQAVPILASGRSIDLMISDVGLPGMNGRQLAEIARQNRPELPILFITGYAENAAIRSDFLGTRMAMIAKPFNIEVLAAKIGEMIPSRAGRGPIN